MASTQTRIDELKVQFSKTSDWESRYKVLIESGKALSPMNESYRTETFKVKGCTSQVWLHAQLNSDGGMELQADSDSALVKGLVAMLVRVYSGQQPADILATPPDFLKELGFDTALTPSRANGLYSMVRQIYLYAQAFRLARPKS